MARGRAVLLGLNEDGLVVLVVLLVLCLPLFWVVWLIDALKGAPTEPVG